NIQTYMLENDKPVCRTFLYFTSESYLHCIRNALILSDIPANKYVAEDIEGMECSYFSHGIVRVFEDPNCTDQEDRFYIDVQFSPGAHGAPLTDTNEDRDVVPVIHACPLTGRYPLNAFFEFLSH
ncbi:hypothetical protein RFI_17342, partial [Reticulomyxa filosa]